MAKITIRGNMATALGAKLCRPDVIPAYPITPSTLFPEKISEYIANGEMDGEMIRVESEHSAMSACIGASCAGARVCTASASQGIALMHEMLFIAAGMRLPIVMAVGNRALSAPINIWCDHQDSISERDSGWLQFYAEKNQEALDLMIMAFKICENKRVLLPGMVGIDAFVLTHTLEAVDIPEQKLVDEFLPKYLPMYSLNPDKSVTFGSFGTPEFYQEFKYAQTKAMDEADKIINEVFTEFKKKFGREYHKVTPYKCEDADVIILTMGSMSGTARAAVNKMREDGKKVGCCKLTVYRPFPCKELTELTKNAKVLAVLDRDISPGFGGALYSEVASQFINQQKHPLITNYILGLGGKEVFIKNFEEIYDKSMNALEKGVSPVEWVGLNKEVL
jgi:pyruvate ferredoxin oxidoreductase alpha subunit